MNPDTLRQLHEAATPGEWRAVFIRSGSEDCSYPSAFIIGADGKEREIVGCGASSPSNKVAVPDPRYAIKYPGLFTPEELEANAALIVFLRNHTPEILELTERLEHCEMLLTMARSYVEQRPRSDKALARIDEYFKGERNG